MSVTARAPGSVRSRRFATGKFAVAECPVCSLIVPYRTLVEDWRGVWVCPDCDDEPPAVLERAEIPADAEGLAHPKPFLDDYPPEDNVDEHQNLNEKPVY